ncbi:hypothetical protein CP970_02395 [Streptomyces kanamyceticus]|uniref:Uncharacterized protein n=1 Tax=Streptomyces kanamyceticus TaxID=1967 RepID=A0A5J6G5Q5_STRKN|nr:hypothetical protein CP970_02395 [Streptomyces kanamyceticus]
MLGCEERTKRYLGMRRSTGANCLACRARYGVPPLSERVRDEREQARPGMRYDLDAQLGKPAELQP